MGKPRGASKTDPSPETSGDSLLDEIWVKLEIKLNAWIANTLPAIVKDLVKAQACKAVDDFVSSSEFTSSLPESLLFDSAELKDSHKATEDKIAKLECVNSQLLEQIDDLEQYTRRTNVRIFGIPEAAGDVRENTDDLAINFFANELHNTKVAILQNRRLLKENKRPFNVQEDLTIARRNILKYLGQEINQGIVSKVWTIDGAILFRPLRHSSTIERCTTIGKCRELINKYSS